MFLQIWTREELAPCTGRLRQMAACRLAFLGCVLTAAGCTLDAKPHGMAQSDVQPSPKWMPPGAAGGDARSDAALASSMRSRSGQGNAGEAHVDGSAMQPASDAGAAPRTPSPGGSQPARDAGQPKPDAASPAVRDASAAPTTPPSTPPSTTPMPDASTTPPATTTMPDAATPTADASTTPKSDAATPTMPIPTPTADASTAPPSTTPDASAPPMPSPCKPGLYSGAFSGSVRANDELIATIDGPLRAELVLDSGAANLELREAGVTIVDRDENRLTITLSGRINCPSRKLQQGSIDGSFYYADSRMSFSFHGAIDGSYMPDPAGVTGTWSGESDDIARVSAEGTWDLQLDD
jgi:hypothetical protein